MPIDALLCVLHKLDPVELLLGGAARACRSWRRTARGEPALWRCVDMRHREDLFYLVDDDRVWAARAAVLRSAGRCEAFWGDDAANDGFLLFLAEQAPLLKSLRLISCNGFTNRGLMKAIKKFPMLEELELSFCQNVFGKVYELVAKACPGLKRLRVSYSCFYSCGKSDRDDEALGIATMSELRFLQLFDHSGFTNVGLKAILDNCLHLDYLDIWQNVNMDVTLRAKCARLKALPPNCTDGYEFQIGDSIRSLWSRTQRVYRA